MGHYRCVFVELFLAYLFKSEKGGCEGLHGGSRASEILSESSVGKNKPITVRFVCRR